MSVDSKAKSVLKSEIALKNLIRKLYSILIVSFRSVYTLSVFFFFSSCFLIYLEKRENYTFLQTRQLFLSNNLLHLKLTTKKKKKKNRRSNSKRTKHAHNRFNLLKSDIYNTTPFDSRNFLSFNVPIFPLRKRANVYIHTGRKKRSPVGYHHRAPSLISATPDSRAQ